MKVLSIPRRTHESRFFSRLADAVEREGPTMVDPSIKGMSSFDFDVLHLNFPTHYITQSGFAVALCYSLGFGLYMAVTRLLGRAIVYTVHDVVPFNTRHRPLLRAFLWLTHSLASGFIFLSSSSRDSFVKTYPRECNRPWIMVHHGCVPAKMMTDNERAQQRHNLVGADDVFIIGFLGRSKPYKNIEALKDLPRRLPDGRLVVALVAGRSEPDYAATIEAVLNIIGQERTIRLDQALSDAELDRLTQCADAVALPYKMGSNSGAVLLALENETPVISSRLPMFQELKDWLGESWVRTTEFGASLKDVVFAMAANPPTQEERGHLQRFLAENSFDAAAKEIVKFYRHLSPAP